MTETWRLIEAAREMERNNPVGPGAVTEFDDLFRIGYKALVESLVTAADNWKGAAATPGASDAALVDCLEAPDALDCSKVGWPTAARCGSRCWRKCKTKRLGQAGDVHRKYGARPVHAAVPQLRQHPRHPASRRRCLARTDFERPATEGELKLLEDLESKIPARQAAEQLSLVLEAVIENYGEYRDYNSTTTQSDRGDMLYTLLDFLRLRTSLRPRVRGTSSRSCWRTKFSFAAGGWTRPQSWRRGAVARNSRQDAPVLGAA